MVPVAKDPNIYLSKKLKELIEEFSDENINRYIDYYEGYPVSLQNLFSLFHYELNRLLRHLNTRISTGHYTAYESRKLYYLIDEIKTIQSNLKRTSLAFELNSYYEQRLNECEDFLRGSGGSPIPVDFEKVNLTESEPIFNIRNTIKIPRKERTVYFEKKMIDDEGSYANVYKYKDEYYNKFFVIKKARKDLTEKELERFKREFEEMKRLKSPYIIEVYNFDEENNEYIMEYADFTLDKFITQNNSTLSIQARINLIRQIFQAFFYINGKGILHRDISTKNVLIKKYDDFNIVKVSDFGLVKITDSTLTNKNTEIKGSLNDPKLEFIGFDKYEIRHETYALTRLIYFVMTGRRTLGSFKSKEFEYFFMKGTDDNIDNRYKDIKEIRDAFMNIKSF